MQLNHKTEEMRILGHVAGEADAGFVPTLLWLSCSCGREALWALVLGLSECSRSDHADICWSVNFKQFFTITDITLNAVRNSCLLLPLSVLISRVRFFSKEANICGCALMEMVADLLWQVISCILPLSWQQCLASFQHFPPKGYSCFKEMYWPW